MAGFKGGLLIEKMNLMFFRPNFFLGNRYFYKNANFINEVSNICMIQSHLIKKT